jgi:hypothetical protein
MTRHMMGQGLFLGQMRLGLLLSSTDAITSWQKRRYPTNDNYSFFSIVIASSYPAVATASCTSTDC